MFYKNQKVLVYGLKRSGVASAKVLISLGALVTVFDDDESVYESEPVKEVLSLGASVFSGEESAIDKIDVLMLSPAVPIDKPLCVVAKRQGKIITGELEFASSLILSPIVAVSGTNGKTTVSTLVYTALKEAEYKCELVGNTGTPIAEKLSCLTADTVAVTEVSSFQLETVSTFKPHVAVMLNVTPDHLDRHYNFENYAYLKSKLFKNMGKNEYAVLNYDDETVRGFAEKISAKIIWFSVREKVDGAYLDGDNICFFGEVIMPVSELKIIGEHNVKNALAAVATLKTLGVRTGKIRASFSSFGGVRHRLELVCSFFGTDFFDDSKGTNVDATLKAVSAMKKSTVILLGGRDKDQDFTKLFNAMKASPVCHAVLTGEARYKLLADASKANFQSVSVVAPFEAAVRLAYFYARDNCDVLLSPACASFDLFSGYGERGEKFTEIVKTVCEEQRLIRGLKDGSDCLDD